MARRNSASLALSGLYSLNMSSIDGSALNIDIDPEAGYTCEFLWCACSEGGGGNNLEGYGYIYIIFS